MEIFTTFNADNGQIDRVIKCLQILNIKKMVGFFETISNSFPYQTGWYPKKEITCKPSDIIRVDNMTNKLMTHINSMKFRLSSSATPGICPFDITGNTPYNPFYDDFRVTGNCNYGILEIPMTTNKKQVFNPCLSKEIFQDMISDCEYFSSLCVVIDFKEKGDSFEENMRFLYENIKDKEFLDFTYFL